MNRKQAGEPGRPFPRGNGFFLLVGLKSSRWRAITVAQQRSHFLFAALEAFTNTVQVHLCPMRFRSAFLLLLLATAATALIVGCDSAGTTGEQPGDEPTENGSVNVALARSVNSDVPSSADSAIVRVYTNGMDFNQTKVANIPDPGSQTEVSFSVPSGEGYRSAVLVTKSDTGTGADSGDKLIMGTGKSSTFAVGGGDTARADLDVRPAELSLEVPSSIRPNEVDTVTATYGINLVEIYPGLMLSQRSTPRFNYSQGGSSVAGGATDTSITDQFEITGPDVATEDTTYLKIRTTKDVQRGWRNPQDGWQPEGIRFGARYFPSKNGPSFKVPVVPDSSNGTVIITFSRGEDGWKKTRRLVE
ncbi:hypothetical protein GGP72_002911 [Salinibacter ruber]|uniref:Uncharacterized protein n=1 Tax=Salinibacter ruber TaxID=146919 RepID=A0A9X2Q6A9_9BACT|nr:hypothetical protein [Salinibacter ruber]MCS3678685.1 hypothetical protein [Salinibacter ruber]MCS3682251.1 hypothetical protein [Salinibacter ruber]